MGDHIAKEEIREALKKMANGKAVGPDQISIEVWKFMGEVGLEWLTELLAQSSHCIKIKEIFKIVITLGASNCSATL